MISGNLHLACDYLKNVHLVENEKMTIPLFEEFILDQKQNLLRQTLGKIEYDETSHEIKRGEITISEGLTSSEFKLLKFLIKNPEKILERDEVINAVWEDLSSTVGVSEQALDQLIFRLRKKIEENPNSPIHIQTIKGRGFKFSP